MEAEVISNSEIEDMTGTMDSKDPNLEKIKFTIGTWNMDHWKRTREQREKGWEYMRTESKADVMLLQESVAAPGLNRSQFVYREISGHCPWGSSVVAFNEDMNVQEIDAVRTRYGAKRFSMLGTFPGAVIVTQVEVPGIGPITCVSVYGLINVYAQTTILRVIADLIPLFDSRFGSRVVLGGDLNISSACNRDRLHEPERIRYRAILDAVESLGLINLVKTAEDRPKSVLNCPCTEDECYEIPTYRGGQLDWLYATPELARRCTRLRVDHDVVYKLELSDHAPLIAEFEIPPTVPDRIWDPDAFVEEMKFIAGPEAARIAEDLIDWAVRKHGKLQSPVHRVSYDRLPTGMASGKLKIWFQLDIVPREIIQWTFSILADGEIEINFQWMIAPYDALEIKEKLWNALNQIEGVSLQKNLTGRPRFRIGALAETDRLEQFTKVFSDMIDTTLRRRNVVK